MMGLGVLHGNGSSFAYGISEDGSIVVGNWIGDTGNEAFIWDQQNGMRSLQDVLTNDFGLDLTGWTLTTARAISDDGLVVTGYGLHNGLNEAWVATLPGPSFPCQLSLEGDLNGDCIVNAIDLSMLASNWLQDLSHEPGAFLPEGIYVAPPEWGGSDWGGCGSVESPCASVNYGIIRAADEIDKNYVFVADGTYEESVTIFSGINLWGGFNPVTWVRKEPALSNSVLIGIEWAGHAKTLIADSINESTEVSRFHIKGADVTLASGNSYAVYITDSNELFVITDNYIYAGRGADGEDGTDGQDGTTVPDGIGGIGASDPFGSVIMNEWQGAAGTAGTDEVHGGSGGTAGGGAFGIFVNNSVLDTDKPSLVDNVIYAGRGGNGGDGGFGGIGDLEGAGGGGGGGAGGISCGIFTWNVINPLDLDGYNLFIGTGIGGNGGKGGKSFSNSGTDGIAGAGLDYYYEGY